MRPSNNASLCGTQKPLVLQSPLNPPLPFSDVSWRIGIGSDLIWDRPALCKSSILQSLNSLWRADIRPPFLQFNACEREKTSPLASQKPCILGGV